MTADVTRLLDELRGGDESRFPELVAAVQEELRVLAAAHLRRERADHTLQPTALVNEAYVKLVDQRERSWESRSHFLSIASRAMRRVLLEHARARLADKRGGGRGRVTLFEVESALDEQPEALVALDEALERFARIDAQNARVVELRFFGGLDTAETAETLGVSTRTVERGWRAARAWLRDQLATAEAE
jgi:RNA polymerase sigma factor (TIGR02999 family)